MSRLASYLKTRIELSGQDPSYQSLRGANKVARLCELEKDPYPGWMQLLASGPL